MKKKRKKKKGGNYLYVERTDGGEGMKRIRINT